MELTDALIIGTGIAVIHILVLMFQRNVARGKRSDEMKADFDKSAKRIRDDLAAAHKQMYR